MGDVSHDSNAYCTYMCYKLLCGALHSEFICEHLNLICYFIQTINPVGLLVWFWWQIGFQLLFCFSLRVSWEMVFGDFFFALSPLFGIWFNVRREKPEKNEMIWIVINLNAKMVFISWKEPEPERENEKDIIFFFLSFVLSMKHSCCSIL